MIENTQHLGFVKGFFSLKNFTIQESYIQTYNCNMLHSNIERVIYLFSSLHDVH